MNRPNSVSTRRAVLASVGTFAAGGGVVYAGSQLGSEPTSQSSPSSPSSDGPSVHRRSGTTGFDIDLAGHPILGSTDATLDMYYWSDYQCPFCQRFETETLPKLVENHIETGTVRLVYIQYPYLSQDSLTAAVMDRCVWRQVRESTPDRYRDWHSAVFDAQGEKGSGWASRDSLLDITRGVDGVDADAVDSCMQNNRGEIESSIATDVDRARQLGLQGSPAFIFYNRDTGSDGRLVGAQPYEQFEAKIADVRNA